MRFYSIVVLAAFLEQDSLIIWIFQDRYKHMTDNMIRYMIDTLKPWEFKSKALNFKQNEKKASIRRNIAQAESDC